MEKICERCHRRIFERSFTTWRPAWRPFELRQEIARYLYHSRGVNCTPEQIIVGSGTEQLMPLVIRILGLDATYAIEDPGYPLTHHVFYHNNREVIPIQVDKEGMDISILQKSEALSLI